MRFLLATFLFGGQALWAQQYTTQGYVFQGFGSSLFARGTTGHTGGGGEGRIYKGLTAGGDIGAVYSLEGGSGSVVGLGNLSAAYHIPVPRSPWDPFVRSGYSIAFRSDTASGFHLGGGVAYWFRRGLAIRTEVLHYEFRGSANFTEFRVGLAFR